MSKSSSDRVALLEVREPVPIAAPTFSNGAGKGGAQGGADVALDSVPSSVNGKLAGQASGAGEQLAGRRTISNGSMSPVSTFVRADNKAHYIESTGELTSPNGTA